MRLVRHKNMVQTLIIPTPTFKSSPPKENLNELMLILDIEQDGEKKNRYMSFLPINHYLPFFKK